MQRPNSKFAPFGLAMLLAFSAGCSNGRSGPTTPAIDTTAPTVSSTSPADGATGVGAITATFSEAMTSSTVSAATFSLTGPGVAAVPGTVSYGNSNNMARFTPASDLASGTTYTATVTNGVKDVSGNAMAVNKVWTFTTSAAPNVPANPRTD